jgi:hypothetical protein
MTRATSLPGSLFVLSVLSFFVLFSISGCDGRDPGEIVLGAMFLPSAPIVPQGREACALTQDGIQGVSAASVPIDIDLGVSFRLAGYGVFPFWQILGSSGTLGASEPQTTHLTGQLTVLAQGGSKPSWWVLVVLDTIGVPSPLALQLAAVVRGAILGPSTADPLDVAAAGNKTVGGCVMTTVVATHSHSGPDLTGLWGANARSWSRDENARAFQDVVDNAVAGGLRQALGNALQSARPFNLSLGSGHVPTSARSDGPGQQQQKRNLSVIRFVPSSVGAVSPAPDPLVWIWDGHATTVGSGRMRSSGDFPAAVAAAVGNDYAATFLPGTVAGQYPIQRPGWLETLAETVRQNALETAQPFTFELLTEDFCMPVQSRASGVLETWAAWWGVQALMPCEGAPMSSATQKMKVTLQWVVFRKIGTGGKEGAAIATLLFVPFESFSQVQDLVFEWFFQDQIGSGNPGGVFRVVSLAGGFAGHGFTDRLAHAVFAGSVEPRHNNGAKAYHMWLSLVSSVENLWNSPVAQIDWCVYS